MSHVHGSPDKRTTTGRALQRRRLRIWRADPHCATPSCRQLVPLNGFELDHIVPLHLGGADSDANSQVLCPSCHAEKTAREAHAHISPIGEDGMTDAWRAEK